jgi:hypothetical protein
MSNPTAVYVTLEAGEYVRRFDGDAVETLDGYVWVGNDDGDPVGKVYGPMPPARARKLGQQMAADRRLELVIENP